MKYRHGNYHAFWRVVITFLLICSFIVSVFFMRMRPVIIKYAESVAQTAMYNAANEAVLEILGENGITYDDIVVLSRGENGSVTSAEIDIVKINTLKSAISGRLSRKVDEKGYYEVKIPVGTFFSNVYTNALGPKLPFKMQLTATVGVNFSHEFKSVGINQVLHIIMIDMNISGSFVMIGYRGGVTAATSAIAAQTVISGAVPGAYTNVIESENDNTAGLINDYGAVIDD